jgi:hypothetical protein
VLVGLSPALFPRVVLLGLLLWVIGIVLTVESILVGIVALVVGFMVDHWLLPHYTLMAIAAS